MKMALPQIKNEDGAAFRTRMKMALPADQE
jgi:hypothetical protein